MSRRHQGTFVRRWFSVRVEVLLLAVNLTLQPSQHVDIVCVLYWPPGAVSRVFCDQLADVFDQLLLCGRRFVVCGDFNCPGAGDNQLDTSLIDVLQRYNLLQHVRGATHDGGNTLELLLTPTDDAALLSRVTVHPTCFSDHYSVACQLHQPRNVPTAVRYQFRDLRRIDIATFQHDVYRSPLYDFNRATSTDEYAYVQLFNSEMRRILDLHAPLKTRTRRAGHNDCRWLSVEARDAKRSCRLERRYRRTLAAPTTKPTFKQREQRRGERRHHQAIYRCRR